ncbi:MAG: L,D-transpeptidase [Bdellovibrionia bacterium]
MKLLIIAATLCTLSVAALAENQPFIAKPSRTKYGTQSVGRFLYTGDAPKILNSSDLELHVSKTMLTVRVKAWVSVEQHRVYAAQLFQHWDAIRLAFANDFMTFEPLADLNDYAASEKKADRKAQWLLSARYYMKSNLEDRGLDIYNDELAVSDKAKARVAYKNKILLALLRSYTLSNASTIEDGLRLAELAKRGDHGGLANALGPQFFERHLKDNYNETAERAGYVGLLNFVYPIAATTAGPFSIEREGLYDLGRYSSDEARWHSPRWDDEFGGFPFLAYTSYGIALHGPITLLSVPGLPGEEFANNNFWFLRRDYVSHGCHRMEGSDIMELRQMLPDDITVTSKNSSKVKVVSQIWPDSDVIAGTRVAFNVDYYTPVVSMLAGETAEQAVTRLSPVNVRETYLRAKLEKLKAPSQDPKNLRIVRLEPTQVVFDGVQTYTEDGTNLARGPLANGVRLVRRPDHLPVYRQLHPCGGNVRAPA